MSVIFVEPRDLQSVFKTDGEVWRTFGKGLVGNFARLNTNLGFLKGRESAIRLLHRKPCPCMFLTSLCILETSPKRAQT